MSPKSISEEIINEIGTQTLARFGLNIFSLNTLGAYGASVKSTNIITDTYNRHKNNKVGFGQYFEDIDVGQKNIKSALFNKGERTYTTDELADIKKISDIRSSNKKPENLNEKDRKKYDFVMQNYAQEVFSINNHTSMKENANKNDISTDTVTFDKNGNVIERSQHKVIKDTNGLLKDRYLKDNDVFTVPFDDYKKHKENLEEMIADKSDPEKAQKAKQALDMLNKNNQTNRLMCENPRATAMLMQSGAAASHVAQAGLSDAIVVALSSLANGAIWEIKDALNNKGDVPITDRIKRLLKKVLSDFNTTFKRGASFGALDIGVGILSQIFKSISAKLTSLWKSIRTSMKSIFNAIYDYMGGKIKSYKQLISTILKGILSAILVIGTITLEAELEIFLAPIFSPIVASFLAPALAIIIGSIAVVLSMQSIDMALNALFGIFAKRNLAKLNYEKVQNIFEDLMPNLIEEKENLKALIEETYKNRKLSYEKSFSDFKQGLLSNDIKNIMCGLNSLNSMYNAKLQFATFGEFNNMMCDNDSFEF